jgi:hypothetical protein
MLDSPVIDVVLGLILMYFVLALVCSAADGGSAPSLEQAIGQLSTLPVGWHAESIPAGFEAWAAALLGWVLTTAAISLGAPFWFDLMGRVARLRGTGNRPEPQSGQRN